MIEKVKRKREFAHRRRMLMLALTAGFSILVGIVGTAIFVPPQVIPYEVEGVVVDTTPYAFYALITTEDIPCGARIRSEQVLETWPEQVVIKGYYPSLPTITWTDAERVYQSFAVRDLPQGTRISYQDFVAEDKGIACPTPAADIASDGGSDD